MAVVVVCLCTHVHPSSNSVHRLNKRFFYIAFDLEGKTAWNRVQVKLFLHKIQGLGWDYTTFTSVFSFAIVCKS